MADGDNFTIGSFPEDAIEYSSTLADSSSEITIPSVLISSIMLLGQILWLRMSSRQATVEKCDLEPNNANSVVKMI
ncbi:uncharacterized protein LOC128253694 [Drosophila gunungcola]|uniref:uncharacterized protein LOC128253694 n=1 Tax=Drosophila gunungcola TaxID=103775 RepID=UPI0022E56562|nr:uncharacterized protein LOC128253694 [Drosophila gunungcola]XP_052838261.1 uncharacterized protein LOC128253694 [Drosophila gunungcola]